MRGLYIGLVVLGCVVTISLIVLLVVSLLNVCEFNLELKKSYKPSLFQTMSPDGNHVVIQTFDRENKLLKFQILRYETGVYEIFGEVGDISTENYKEFLLTDTNFTIMKSSPSSDTDIIFTRTEFDNNVFSQCTKSKLTLKIDTGEEFITCTYDNYSEKYTYLTSNDVAGTHVYTVSSDLQTDLKKVLTLQYKPLLANNTLMYLTEHSLGITVTNFDSDIPCLAQLYRSSVAKDWTLGHTDIKWLLGCAVDPNNELVMYAFTFPDNIPSEGVLNNPIPTFLTQFNRTSVQDFFSEANSTKLYGDRGVDFDFGLGVAICKERLVALSRKIDASTRKQQMYINVYSTEFSDNISTIYSNVILDKSADSSLEQMVNFSNIGSLTYRDGTYHYFAATFDRYPQDQVLSVNFTCL